jgi:hypothetical protein
MALELVYWVENRCKMSGAPAEAFPKPSRGRVGPVCGPKSTISGPMPPERKKNKSLKTHLAALETGLMAQADPKMDQDRTQHGVRGAETPQNGPGFSPGPKNLYPGPGFTWNYAARPAVGWADRAG